MYHKLKTIRHETNNKKGKISAVLKAVSIYDRNKSGSLSLRYVSSEKHVKHCWLTSLKLMCAVFFVFLFCGNTNCFCCDNDGDDVCKRELFIAVQEHMCQRNILLFVAHVTIINKRFMRIRCGAMRRRNTTHRIRCERIYIQSQIENSRFYHCAEKDRCRGENVWKP